MAMKFNKQWEEKVDEFKIAKIELKNGEYRGIIESAVFDKNQDNFECVKLCIEITDPVKYRGKKVFKSFILDADYQFSKNAIKAFDELVYAFGLSYNTAKDFQKMLPDLASDEKVKRLVQVTIGTMTKGGVTYQTKKITKLGTIGENPLKNNQLNEAEDNINLESIYE